MFPEDIIGLEGTEVQPAGRNQHNGQFVKGNTFAQGRPKGRRNVLTQMMLDHAAAAEQQPFEVLYDIYHDDTLPPDLRFKAAAKYADLIYPKAASVEVKIDDEHRTEEAVDNQIKDFLSSVGINILPPEEEEVQEAE